MDYKEKYEQALLRARQVHTTNVDENKKSTEYIFPELKESEDERMIRIIEDAICTNEAQQLVKTKYRLELRDLADWLEKQGKQKSTKKVEPKFKVGDWITDGTSTFQIVKIEDECYIADDGQKLWINVINKYYHLWTIQDAKDGDVLAAKDIVFMFKHMDKTGLSLCKSYCEVIGNSKLGLGFDFSINSVYPATEEQYNLLFQKMHEAGYEWDTDKKELKKIEKPTEWSEEDESMLQQALSTIRYALSIPADKEDDPCFAGSSTIAWLKSLKERMKENVY